VIFIEAGFLKGADELIGFENASTNRIGVVRFGNRSLRKIPVGHARRWSVFAVATETRLLLPFLFL
jgi:hypothetical protein